MDSEVELKNNCNAKKVMNQEPEAVLEGIVSKVLAISKIRNFLIHGYRHKSKKLVSC
jgi:hypothetical protein